MLAFGDVAVDQHKPAIWHRVVADLDHGPVRSGSLEAVVVSKSRAQPGDLAFGGGVTKLAALRQVADIRIVRGPLGEKRHHRRVPWLYGFMVDYRFR